MGKLRFALALNLIISQTFSGLAFGQSTPRMPSLDVSATTSLRVRQADSTAIQRARRSRPEAEQFFSEHTNAARNALRLIESDLSEMANSFADAFEDPAVAQEEARRFVERVMVGIWSCITSNRADVAAAERCMSRIEDLPNSAVGGSRQSPQTHARSLARHYLLTATIHCDAVRVSSPDASSPCIPGDRFRPFVEQIAQTSGRVARGESWARDRARTSGTSSAGRQSDRARLGKAVGSTTGELGGRGVEGGSASGTFGATSKSGGVRGIEGGTGSAPLRTPPPSTPSPRRLTAEQQTRLQQLETQLGCPSFIDMSEDNCETCTGRVGIAGGTASEAQLSALSPAMREIMAACPAGQACDTSRISSQRQELINAAAEMELRNVLSNLRYLVLRPQQGPEYYALLRDLPNHCASSLRMRSVLMRELEAIRSEVGPQAERMILAETMPQLTRAAYVQELMMYSRQLVELDAQIADLLADFVDPQQDPSAAEAEFIRNWRASTIGGFIPCRSVFEVGDLARRAVARARSRAAGRARGGVCQNREMWGQSFSTADNGGAIGFDQSRAAVSEAQARRVLECRQDATSQEACLASCRSSTPGYVPSQADKLLQCQRLPLFDQEGNPTLDQNGLPIMSSRFGPTSPRVFTQAEACQDKGQNVARLMAQHAQIRSRIAELNARSEGTRPLYERIARAGNEDRVNTLLNTEQVQTLTRRAIQQSAGYAASSDGSGTASQSGIRGAVRQICSNPEAVGLGVFSDSAAVQQLLSCNGRAPARVRLQTGSDPGDLIGERDLPGDCRRLRENAPMACLIMQDAARDGASRQAFSQLMELADPALDGMGCGMALLGLSAAQQGMRSLWGAVRARVVAQGIGAEIQTLAASGASRIAAAELGAVAESQAAAAFATGAAGRTAVVEVGSEGAASIVNAVMARAQALGVTVSRESVEAAVANGLRGSVTSSTGTALRFGAGALTANARALGAEIVQSGRNLLSPRDPEGIVRAFTEALEEAGEQSPQLARRLANLPPLNPHLVSFLGFGAYGVGATLYGQSEAERNWRQAVTRCYTRQTGCDALPALQQQVEASFRQGLSHTLGMSLIGALIPGGPPDVTRPVHQLHVRLTRAQDVYVQAHSRLGTLREQYARLAETDTAGRRRLEAQIRDADRALGRAQGDVARLHNQFRDAYLASLDNDLPESMIRVGDRQVPLSEMIARYPDVLYSIAMRRGVGSGGLAGTRTGTHVGDGPYRTAAGRSSGGDEDSGPRLGARIDDAASGSASTAREPSDTEIQAARRDTNELAGITTTRGSRRDPLGIRRMSTEARAGFERSVAMIRSMISAPVGPRGRRVTMNQIERNVARQPDGPADVRRALNPEDPSTPRVLTAEERLWVAAIEELARARNMPRDELLAIYREEAEALCSRPAR